MYSPYIILGIDKSNRIRLLSVYVDSQEDIEASWKLLMAEMRIALATLGEDKQEDGSNATFAMLDALKREWEPIGILRTIDGLFSPEIYFCRNSPRSYVECSG